MAASTQRYVVDEQGNRIAVLLDIVEYERLLEELDELDATRAYDAAKAAGDDFIPLDQAFDEVDTERR